MDRGVGTRRRASLRLDAERFRIYPTVRFEVDQQVIDATVFPLDGIRQAPVSPVDGRPMRRADASELEALLTGEARRDSRRAWPERRSCAASGPCTDWRGRGDAHGRIADHLQPVATQPNGAGDRKHHREHGARDAQCAFR